MKRLFLLGLVLALVAGLGFAQNLTVIDDDFNTFFEVLGRDMLPHLQQNAANGIAVGDAAVPNYRTVTLGSSIGAVLSDGWQAAVDDPDLDGADDSDYELLPIDTLLSDLIPADPVDFYGELFPYPSTRLTLGGTVAGWQILATGMVWPQALTEAAVGLAGDVDALDLAALEFSILNLGGQVRRTLVPDTDGFPAVTAGLAYSYGGMDISVPLPADLVPDDLGISLEADALKVDTAVHTAGLELSVSKKLAFFVPFVTVMPYFQRSSFTAAIPDFDAVIGEGDNKISYSDQAGENADPGATVNLYDFALAARGGFDLVLGGFGLFVHAQYNLATGAPAVTTGTRLSF